MIKKESVNNLKLLLEQSEKYLHNSKLLSNVVSFGGDQTWETLLNMPVDEEQSLVPLGYENDEDDRQAWPLCTKQFHKKSHMRFIVYMPPYSRFILHGHSDAKEHISKVEGYIWGAKTRNPDNVDSYIPFSLTDGETITFEPNEWHWVKAGKIGTWLQVDFYKA